jgi:hypothetical protein
MLSLKDIDLDMLTTAMENASYEMQWWLDPDTGELELTGETVDEGLSPEELEERGSKGSVLSAISRTRCTTTPGPGRLVHLPRKAHAPPRRHVAPVRGTYRRAGSPRGVRRGLLSAWRTEA